MQVIPVGSREGATSQMSAPTTSAPVSAQKHLDVPHGDAAGFGHAGAWSVLRIETINIDGDVNGPLAQHTADFLDDCSAPEQFVLIHLNHSETHPVSKDDVVITIAGSSQADLQDANSGQSGSLRLRGAQR